MILSSFGYEPIDIASIYIGGGTPSLLSADQLSRWVEQLREYINFLPGYEFSIEVNPETLTDDFARAAYTAGVNRMVIGIQSFHMSLLRKLNRRQTTKDIYRAFYLARMAGFENIGADIIFGLPGQKLRHLKLDLERTLALGPRHLSFYQLTVEPDTVLARKIDDGSIVLPDDDSMAKMYQYGCHLLIDRGFHRYEVSNFAPDEYRSRHNYVYWNGTPYLAFGPGGHGFLHGYRYGNVADVRQYIEMLRAGRPPVAMVEPLDDNKRLIETVMLSLRTAEGLDVESLRYRFGSDGHKIVESKAVISYLKSGHLQREGGFVRLTDAGFLVADKIILDIVS